MADGMETQRSSGARAFENAKHEKFTPLTLCIAPAPVNEGHLAISLNAFEYKCLTSLALSHYLFSKRLHISESWLRVPIRSRNRAGPEMRPAKGIMGSVVFPPQTPYPIFSKFSSWLIRLCKCIHANTKRFNYESQKSFHRNAQSVFIAQTINTTH